MAGILLLATIFATLSLGFCASCSNPKVTSKSFTTQDATIVLNIAFISEFSVKCRSGKVGNLYAELDGNIVPVSVVGHNKFQVSWTEDTKSARAGDKTVRIFDEDGYTSYRKVQRSGEDLSAVSALFNVVIDYPGAYNGPWLKSEFIATVLSLAVAYFAVVSKAKVIS